MARTTTPGVLYRHSRDCRDHERCAKNCNESAVPWEAWVFDAKYVDPSTGTRGKKIRQRFATHAAAKGWRTDAAKQVRDHKLRATEPTTLRKEVAAWLEGVHAGRILNKRDQPYKPAVVRNYELSLRLRVLPELGDRRLADITLADLLALKENLSGQRPPLSGSTIRNTFVPLQAIYRRARLTGAVPIDPTLDLPLPTAGSRDRAATPKDAAELLSALGEGERPIYAAAFYSGLRRGELRALRVGDVDLDGGTIRVERGWDDGGGQLGGWKDSPGPIEPKSRAGARTVFLLDVLRPTIATLLEGRAADELVFGKGEAVPFEPKTVARKAAAAWKHENGKRTEDADERGEQPALLDPLTLHEARHSFSTWLDHAGVSADRADRYMGHSSGNVASRYRHLLPSQLAEDARYLAAFLDGSAAGKVVALAAAG